jgi:hypothetical protein
VAIRSKMSATNELRMPKRMKETSSMSARERGEDVKTGRQRTHGLVGDTSVGVDLLQHLVDVRRVGLGLRKIKKRRRQFQRSRLIANTRSETHPLGLLLLLVGTLSLGGGGLGSLSGSLRSGRGLGGGTGRGRGLRSRTDRKSDDMFGQGKKALPKNTDLGSLSGLGSHFDRVDLGVGWKVGGGLKVEVTIEMR